MLDKISNFCKKVNHVLIFIILSIMLIAIIILFSSNSSRTELDININNAPLVPTD